MQRLQIRKSAFNDRGVPKFPARNSKGILCGWLTIEGFTRWLNLKETERLTHPVAAEVVSLRK